MKTLPWPGDVMAPTGSCLRAAGALAAWSRTASIRACGGRRFPAADWATWQTWRGPRMRSLPQPSASWNGRPARELQLHPRNAQKRGVFLRAQPRPVRQMSGAYQALRQAHGARHEPPSVPRTADTEMRLPAPARARCSKCRSYYQLACVGPLARTGEKIRARKFPPGPPLVAGRPA